MPKGMRLKSDGFASSLADPESKFTLASYCQHEGLEYKDTGHPVPLETFVSYGLAFQKKFVPNLENRMVMSVRQPPAGFDLQLEDGEQVLARKVVVAVGISHFAHVPNSLSTLPAEFVSHSSAHSNLEAFKDRQIAVIGAGASALDLAALLHEAGASVQLIARSSTIRFHDPPQPRSLADRILKPSTGLGAGMQLFFYVNAPLVFRQLPEELRLDRVRKTLGPAPGWFAKDQVVGKVSLNLGMDISSASVHNGRVSLQLIDGEKRQRTIDVDHVIAATGYQVDLQRLSFLDREMLGKIRVTDKSPALSSTFESSVPGLYFVGVVAANTFGPLMRFACGGRFTARRLSKHLADRARSMSALHENSKKEQAMERI
jgi:thioredoxin reductase